MSEFQPTEERQKIVDELIHALAEEGELVTDVIVVAKVIDDEGHSVVRSISSTGTDWLARRVLLDVAHSVELDIS